MSGKTQVFWWSWLMHWHLWQTLTSSAPHIHVIHNSVVSLPVTHLSLCLHSSFRFHDQWITSASWMDPYIICSSRSHHPQLCCLTIVRHNADYLLHPHPHHHCRCCCCHHFLLILVPRCCCHHYIICTSCLHHPQLCHLVIVRYDDLTFSLTLSLCCLHHWLLPTDQSSPFVDVNIDWSIQSQFTTWHILQPTQYPFNQQIVVLALSIDLPLLPIYYPFNLSKLLSCHWWQWLWQQAWRSLIAGVSKVFNFGSHVDI